MSVITALMMEAVRTSETSVYSKENTRRYIPEGSYLQVSLISCSCHVVSYLIKNKFPKFYIFQKITNPALLHGLIVSGAIVDPIS
jgi:acyl-CoA hydrolase